jgi:hypothetical protein
MSTELWVLTRSTPCIEVNDTRVRHIGVFTSRKAASTYLVGIVKDFSWFNECVLAEIHHAYPQPNSGSWTLKTVKEDGHTEGDSYIIAPVLHGMDPT